MKDIGLLNDIEIKELCLSDKPMISPFLECSEKVDEKGVRIFSRGLSSFGYDVSIKDVGLRIFKSGVHIDPKAVKEENFFTPDICDAGNGRYIVIPPRGGLLAHTKEYFRIPDDVFVTCQSKSTYARAFLQVIVTPLEPGWEGELVVEVANLTNNFARFYIDEGIAQLSFTRGRRPSLTYPERGGKYQGQLGTQTGIV